MRGRTRSESRRAPTRPPRRSALPTRRKGGTCRSFRPSTASEPHRASAASALEMARRCGWAVKAAHHATARRPRRGTTRGRWAARRRPGYFRWVHRPGLTLAELVDLEAQLGRDREALPDALAARDRPLVAG